jgi:hypothetical protein
VVGIGMTGPYSREARWRSASRPTVKPEVKIATIERRMAMADPVSISPI